jgi:cAMP-dependent protein kinase inhibitor
MDKEKLEPQPTTDAAAKNGNEKNDQDEFYNTGRIGRRNAMPDILGNNCTASSGGDLPLKLSALTTNGELTVALTSSFSVTYRQINFQSHHPVRLMKLQNKQTSKSQQRQFFEEQRREKSTRRKT